MLPAVFAMLSLPARAASFTPREPQISLFGAKAMLCTGALLSLAALGKLLFDTISRRRVAFSLRWLLAFSISCGLAIGGAARMKLAEAQLVQYNAEVELRSALNQKISFCIGGRSLKESLTYLEHLSKLSITVEPKLAARSLPLVYMRCSDIKLENACKALAANVGLECTFAPGTLTLTESVHLACSNEEPPNTGIDQGVQWKLAKTLPIDYADHSELVHALHNLGISAMLPIVIPPKIAAEGLTVPGLKMHQISIASVLEKILPPNNLTYQIRDEAVYIVKASNEKDPGHAHDPRAHSVADHD